jgi:DHA1 family tetracycline resistance protein-like MFS transporter
MNNLFSYFTKENAPVYFPGSFFLLGAILMLASVIIAWKVLSKERKTKPEFMKAIDGKIDESPPE